MILKINRAIFSVKFSGGRLLLNEGRQSIGDCAVVTQAGYFVLSAQFTDAFHVIDETVFLYRGNFKPLQDITGDEVIVIYIPVAQVVVDLAGEGRYILGLFSNSMNHS